METAANAEVLYEDAETFIKDFPSVCNLCSLSQHAGNYPVIARGNPRADILLVGEAPGKKERERNAPFVGPAGQMLDKMFDAIGINTYEDMLITNVVWCRPVAPYGSGKENYTPKEEQNRKCWPFTQKIIELMDPKIIIACGLPALKRIMGTTSIRMGDKEGTWDTKDGRAVFTMRHPASILHLSIDPREQRRVKAKVWTYIQAFGEEYSERIHH